MKPTKTTAKTIDEYISLQPVDVRTALKKVRSAIKSAAPQADEVISYQVCCYKLNGMLVGFAGFKDHCSFFVMSPPLMKVLEKDLQKYEYIGATIHFPAVKPLPSTLVKKIVRARMHENDRRKKTKKK